MRLSILSALPLVLLSACQLPPPEAPVEPSAAAPDLPDAPAMRIVSSADASAAGLAGRDVTVTFGPQEESGARMLEAWFARAKDSGDRVGDLAIYVVHPHDGGAAECRTAIVPETSVETRFVPPRPVMEQVFRPVQRIATHSEYRCHTVMRPESHMETTMTMQYNALLKSMQSVPQSHMVTSQVAHNECGSVPVTSMVTQWEWTPEVRYTPPSTEYLTHERAREGEAVCYAAAEGAVTRVEGKVFVAPN